MGLIIRDTNLYAPILQDAIRGNLAGRLALFGTGVATVNTSLPDNDANGARLKNGDKIVVPYFDHIGELEDIPEGMALTPRGLTSTQEEATIIHSGIAAEITAWARMAAGSNDPYAEVARQFNDSWMRRIDLGLITAAGTTTLISDAAADHAGAAGQMNYDNFIDATMKWNDEGQDVRLMVVHSKVMGDMWKLKDSAGHPLLTPSMRDGDLPRMRGVPVHVSDRTTKTGTGLTTVYDTLILKAGSLVAWLNGRPRVRDGEDVLADTDITALHIYWVTHLYKRSPMGTLPGVVKLKVRAST